MNQKKIVFTGGGTAGHVMPNLSIMEKLVAKYPVQCHYIGLSDSIEQSIVAKHPWILFHSIHSVKFDRSYSITNIFAIYNLLRGVLESKAILQAIQPDLIFSKGSYVAFPVVVAGFLKHTPMIAHESDVTPGLANHWSSKMVGKVLTTFPETTRYYPHKSEVVGTPIRSTLLKGNRDMGYKITNLSQDKPILMVIGGSQGSDFLNQTIRSLLPLLLTTYSVLHICGKGKREETLQTVQGYYQVEFAMEELPHLYAIADVAISRAGANTMMELIALQKPTIFIPLTRKYSRGDQIANALSMEKNHLSLKMEEHEVNESTLLKTLDQLWENKETYRQNMKQYLPFDSAEKISDIITTYW
jgi:UDP-N-acetylglucosamine--N-acetylmuramyl-(pentapeptide) pyrophosphoryl-undecaprenol N-acetylglucosamine transferase